MSKMAPSPHADRPAGRTVALRLLAFALLAATGAGAAAAPVALAPQYAGQFAAGNGANASFVQIDSTWRGSNVLWDEANGVFGSGLAIGSFTWGTGLWGRSDWQTVQQTTTGAGGVGAPRIQNHWTGTVDTINHANALYNSTYAQQWGAASLLPFFDASGAPDAQENWTAHFTGFIRVAEGGYYDFSVLNDDGFFLSIFGAGGTHVETGRDFLNPRERNGFGETLLLSEGLYGFELGMWNRLEAGVVDLRWQQPGSTGWTLVPVTSLLPVSAVPEAPALLLAALGLACVLPASRRRHGLP